MSRALRHLGSLAAVLAAIVVVAGPANAAHSWNGYHWSRTANPFTVQFGDNLSSNWDPFLTQGTVDWSVISGACNNPLNPVRAAVVAGGGNSRTCRPKAGKVQVCNYTYGNTGWLGIASIWISGTHITQGTVKVNDTYFNTPQYNTSAWRSAVMDQEMGHTLGLAHQDENFNNADLLDACGRGSCMDYSADPSNNTTPNQHDYDQLVTTYSHLDAAGSPALGLDGGPAANLPGPAEEGVDMEDQSSWGQAVRFSAGRPIVFERDLGAGKKVITFVIWAE